LANDDLIIIRKDMPMDKIFNTAFLTAFVALFFARLFYVIFYPREVFFSPLGFLLFPYFYGLSLLGGVLGGSVFLTFYVKYQKLPVGRTFDFFAVAFLSSLPIGILGFFILTGKSHFSSLIFSFLVYIILLILFLKILLPASVRGKIKNGSIGAAFLFCFSIVTFLSGIISNSKNYKLITPENFTIFFLLLVSIALILKQEMLGKKRIGK
jgi:prolipoprotein diacylglyceryltransferase